MDFIKVASACPTTKVGDIKYNVENILYCINEANKNGSKSIVFPELCITSYTCSDMFLNSTLINNAIMGIKEILEKTKEIDMIIAVGSPVLYRNSLYNSAFILFKGKILGIVPKSFIPNYSEFYEKRWFTEGLNLINKTIDLPFQNNIPFGTNLIFSSSNVNFAYEICEDLWVTIPPSSYLSIMGADIISNLSASNELVSKAEYRRDLIKNQSARCMCAYIYSSAGVHESSTDMLFSGHLLISENGSILKENERFQRDNEVIYSTIDVYKLRSERLKNISFRDSNRLLHIEPQFINFEFNDLNIKNFDRYINKHPFVPNNL